VDSGKDEVVLVVAAHPDDETLGCGATIARLSDEGAQVHVAICADGVSSRPDDENEEAAERRWEQAREAARILGCSIRRLSDSDAARYVFPDNAADVVSRLRISRWVSALVQELKPDNVFTHSIADLNVDHRRVHEAVRVATRPAGAYTASAVYAFEVPSSTEWGMRPFEPTLYVAAATTLHRKLDAMRVYDREQPPFPHPRSQRALQALAAYRGVQCGEPAAEAFELIRGIYF
jgi:LmbE family N-acetylglucosaminyl deacetylase